MTWPWQALSARPYPPSRIAEALGAESPKAARMAASEDSAARLAKMSCRRRVRSSSPTSQQGLTRVHFSAQLERFVWDRGCA